MLYITVPTYILMTCVGLWVSLSFVYCRAKNAGLKFGLVLEYIMVCSVFAVVFARVIFVISMIPSMEKVTINGLLDLLINGGIVFYGGLFGVITGIIVVSARKNICTGGMLDFFAPSFPLFHAFSRLGCLLAGCCYGIEWHWGVILADEPNVVRFPVQFIESTCDVLIFIGLIVREQRKNSSKDNLLIYLGTYALCRFILEFYRGDEVRGIWLWGISTSQFISSIVLLGCGIVLMNRGIQKKRISNP